MENNHYLESWDNVEKELYSPSEIALADLEARVISGIILARHAMGFTQAELAARCGVSQAVISRLESGCSNARFGTLLKVLSALGQTLDVVPIESTKSRAVERKRVRHVV